MRKQCPCCFFFTVEVESEDEEYFEHCPVCLWQYDAAMHDKPDRVAASHGTLNEARRNYNAFGTCKDAFKGDGRPPLPEELPENNRHILKTG